MEPKKVMRVTSSEESLINLIRGNGVNKNLSDKFFEGIQEKCKETSDKQMKYAMLEVLKIFNIPRLKETNLIISNYPYFNPLFGKEEDVIENMVTTYKMFNPDSSQFFHDINENLIRNSLKVLKRLYGNKASLIELSKLIQNSEDAGMEMIISFSRLNADTEAIVKENEAISAWFLSEYFNKNSKVYNHCSSLRSQIAKITSNKYLRRVLNPPVELTQNKMDYELIVKHIKKGSNVFIIGEMGTGKTLLLHSLLDYLHEIPVNIIQGAGHELDSHIEKLKNVKSNYYAEDLKINDFVPISMDIDARLFIDDMSTETIQMAVGMAIRNGVSVVANIGLNNETDSVEYIKRNFHINKYGVSGELNDNNKSINNETLIVQLPGNLVYLID